MNHTKIIQELDRNQHVFKTLLTDTSEEARLWKPKPEKWCLLEIVCHLYDEEREDFRTRTRHTLETPDISAPPIDPEAWVTQRKYMQRDFSEMLDKFLAERTTSVHWLKSLSHPNWNNTYQHPELGAMSAKMFLSNWIAHDYLHIRQILNLKFEYLKQLSNENLSYAGNW